MHWGVPDGTRYAVLGEGDTPQQMWDRLAREGKAQWAQAHPHAWYRRRTAQRHLLSRLFWGMARLVRLCVPIYEVASYHPPTVNRMIKY
jgi:hypothetical protein